MRKYIGFVALMMCTAILIAFTGLTFPSWFATAVLILAIISDFATTYLCLSLRGREGNPIVSFLFKKLSVSGTFVLMAGVWVIFIMFRFVDMPQLSQTAIALTYWLVPANNTIIFAKLIKKVRSVN